MQTAVRAVAVGFVIVNGFQACCGLLKEDGRLTIAHGQSRESIDNHHKGSASKVSNGLMPADSLKKLFDPHFDVEIVISNRKMYQVSGVKRDPLAHAHDGAVAHTHGGLTHSHVHGDEMPEHQLDENATPLEELLVMMKYLVSHNDAHAQEVADLARNLQGAGTACFLGPQSTNESHSSDKPSLLEHIGGVSSAAVMASLNPLNAAKGAN